MLAEIDIGARTWRPEHYRGLADRLEQIAKANTFEIGTVAQRPLPPFKDRLAVVPDFLPARSFSALTAEAERLVAPERSFVPTHKQGGTVAYETLIASARTIVACYHAAGLQEFISRLVGARVQPTPIYDQSSLSVLFYNKPGDHIGWHYDHNFYRGRHFTVLLAIDNVGRAEGGLSHAVLRARLGAGVGAREIAISTAPNTLVAFEGALVRHLVTPILAGERRLMLSMTYCTDARSYWWQGLSRRLKDTAFFGIRALWT
jgi:Phytanoyl-CoA dioxygenase (PhyH)